MDEINIDAEPVPPRNVESTRENQSDLNETQTRKNRAQETQIEIPRDPHDEWELNNLLQKIASSVTDEELAEIKLLFRGQNGLRKRTLEKCNSCAKLFDVLREQQYILKGNIVYLNKILYVLNKPELMEEAAKCCRKEGNAVYYYSVEGEDEPEYGSKCIKFHVVAELNRINQETIERLRNNVAKIVCAPLETVRVVAVEPSSSLVVSIIIPDMYASILEKLLKQEADMWELNCLEVDLIVIGDKRYSLAGTCIKEIELKETEQQRKLMNVYQQLEQTRKELEKTELKALKHREEIKAIEIACKAIQKMHLTSPDADVTLSDLRLFLHQASIEGQNMDLIQKIVESNTLLVAAYIRNRNEAQRQKNKAIWEEKASKEMELWQQLLCRSKSAEEILTLKYNTCTLLQDIKIDETLSRVSFDICKLLNKEEREKLMKLYNWDEKDIVKACIDADEKLLLLGLQCKEATRTQKPVAVFDFISTLLKEIHREDLIEVYKKKVIKIITEEQAEHAANMAEHFITEGYAENFMNLATSTFFKKKPFQEEDFAQD